ncbi:MAG: hypothetical protein KA236_07740 [Verrucomicrobia bacterium]|jgi:hypothetical protein|nr:hypothetical protein [Verrucomicrobiota bacterium]
MSHYAKSIRKLLQCTSKDAAMIEDIMRNDVLHTVALDWLTAQEFNAAAGKAALLLANNRADYEEYYERTREIVEEMRANQAKTAAAVAYEI